MNEYVCFNIEWDTDGNRRVLRELPQRLLIVVPEHVPSDPDSIQDYLSDRLSDITGWCHFGFDFNRA